MFARHVKLVPTCREKYTNLIGVTDVFQLLLEEAIYLLDKYQQVKFSFVRLCYMHLTLLHSERNRVKLLFQLRIGRCLFPQRGSISPVSSSLIPAMVYAPVLQWRLLWETSNCDPDRQLLLSKG